MTGFRPVDDPRVFAERILIAAVESAAKAIRLYNANHRTMIGWQEFASRLGVALTRREHGGNS